MRPDPVSKFLLGFAAACLATYVNALRPTDPSWLSIISSAGLLGLLLGALLVFAVLTLWGLWDLWRVGNREKVRAGVILVIGLFLSDALIQLSEGSDRTAYLTTMIGAFGVILFALAVEAKLLPGES